MVEHHTNELYLTDNKHDTTAPFKTDLSVKWYNLTIIWCKSGFDVIVKRHIWLDVNTFV